MRKKLLIILTLVSLFAMTAIPTFAWSAEINGTEYELDFVENLGIVHMSESGYFNSNLQNKLKGYSFNNGVLYRNSDTVGGDIRALFENTANTVNISHKVRYKLPPDYNPMDFWVDIGNFNSEKGFHIEDRGYEINISSYDPGSKIYTDYQFISSTENSITAYSFLDYELNIDTFAETVYIKKTIIHNGFKNEYEQSFNIDMYHLAYAEGIRYFIPNIKSHHDYYPEFLIVLEFNVDTVTAPSAFLENPQIYAEGFTYAYSEAYDKGYTEGNSHGFSSGLSTGKAEGYDEGYTKGFEFGVDEGRELTLNSIDEGKKNTEAINTFFKGIYTTVSDTLDHFFEYELFGETLGTYLAILAGACLVIIVFKMVRK